MLVLDDQLLEITIRYRPRQVFVLPRGELDVCTANDFRRALDAATADHTRLVVDLVNLGFCGAAGLGVLADTASRLIDKGGWLKLCSPSPMMVKLLDITGLDDLMPVVDAPYSDSTPAVVDAAQLIDDLADGLAEVAQDALVDATMRMVVTVVQRLGSAVDAASVTMRRRGDLVTVAASDPVARDFDEMQYDTGTGPCVEATEHGRLVRGYPGSDSGPWPALRQAARQAGIGSVLSTPVHDAPRMLGALNLYTRGPDFSEADGELASLLVTEAGRILAVEAFDRQDLSDHLSQGLANRDRIARAQGIMMERHNLSAPQAHTRLRREATATETLLNDTAAGLIDEVTRADPPPRPSEEQ